MKGVFKKFIISRVDFVHNGDSTVNERNCEKKYKIFKVKSICKIKINPV